MHHSLEEYLPRREISSSTRRTVLSSACQPEIRLRSQAKATVESNLLECREGDDLSIRTFVYI